MLQEKILLVISLLFWIAVLYKNIAL